MSTPDAHYWQKECELARAEVARLREANDTFARHAIAPDESTRSAGGTTKGVPCHSGASALAVSEKAQPLEDYIAELEKDPAEKAGLDEARRELSQRDDKSPSQIAFDQQSDDPAPGDWNDACRHIAKLLAGQSNDIHDSHEQNS